MNTKEDGCLGTITLNSQRASPEKGITKRAPKSSSKKADMESGNTQPESAAKSSLKMQPLFLRNTEP